jgi:exodeoxyribonuclease VII small subunit
MPRTEAAKAAGKPSVNKAAKATAKAGKKAGKKPGKKAGNTTEKAAVANAETDELPFEAALAKLEQVVDRLEQGDLELEASLAAFEEGVRLSRRCASQLDAAEQRVEVLTREGGEWLERPFASGEAEEGRGADDEASEEDELFDEDED